jgi:UDP-N-acetylmuramoylalanine--D-glutamate ligase
MNTARLDELTSWYADWKGLRVAVLGLSVTGFSVADTLTELGSNVLVLSESASDEYQTLVPLVGSGLYLGSLQSVPDELVRFAPDVVIASPGFSPQHPVIAWTLAAEIPLWGDLELAWRVRDKVTRPDGSPADWILITGTNGKTTTTRMTATMLVESGYRAAPCGNIGVPVLDAVRDPGGFDVLVVEISSHQLWYQSLSMPAGQIVPHSSVCLNFADDHLVWHGSTEAYFDAKAVVYRNTVTACVYNKSDRATLQMVENADVTEGARAIGFDLGSPGPSDFGVVDGILVDRAFLVDRLDRALEISTVEELASLGLGAPHLVENVLAASALARAMDATPEAISAALASFRLDPHRIEVVARFAGIEWIDDSKATNAHAAASSLRAYPNSIWVVGGDLKGVDVSNLIEQAAPKLRAAILIGVERAALVAAFQRHAPKVPIFEVDTADTGEVMNRVVELAAGIAVGGGTVLLAPAAASFDQFRSYEDRGTRFAEAVQHWIGVQDDEGRSTGG